MSRLTLTREAALAAEWDIPLVQFRLLRRRHRWACVRFSRQDIRYTDEQIEQIVRDMTTRSGTTPAKPVLGGQTSRSQKARAG